MSYNATSEDYLRDEAIKDLASNQRASSISENNVTNINVIPGCWVDDHWGVYAVVRQIEIAQDYGFILTDDDELALTYYNKGQDDFELDDEIHSSSDWVYDMSDEAEEWLNDNVAMTGHSFGWSDGNFMLMPDTWWDEENF